MVSIAICHCPRDYAEILCTQYVSNVDRWEYVSTSQRGSISLPNDSTTDAKNVSNYRRQEKKSIR
jgi:hypothetical protein